MPVLPEVVDHTELGLLRSDGGVWRPAIEVVKKRHDLTEEFAPSETGSVVVFLSQSWCIKLHPPLPGDLESCRLELAVLRQLDRADESGLPIPTPKIIAAGFVEGWAYFVATRLPGTAIDDVWSASSADERQGLARELGEGIRALHDLALGPLVEFAAPWDAFVQEQRARCMQRERDRGLDSRWQRAVEAYLRRTDDVRAPPHTPSLLHTEIGPGHVLVANGRITGLIDFGDAAIGDSEYDLAAVGLFVTRGDTSAFRAFCDAYGDIPDRAALADRLLRHALLHRYGTLAWYLTELTPVATTLDDLAKFWFGTE